MKFLKENGYDILRLYINQIGITIFSLILYFSVSSIEDETLGLRIKIAISVFAILFYFALLYTAAWDWGAKDKIRIDAGREKKRAYKGALMSFFANLINFILAGVCLISTLANRNAVTASSMEQIFNLILRMTNAMYIGLIKGVFSPFAPPDSTIYDPNFVIMETVGYLVLPLLAILATHIGYVFGLKEIKIFSSKNSKKNK
jgi:hypothetical protein